MRKLPLPAGTYLLADKAERQMFKHTYYSFEPPNPYGNQKKLVPAQYYASIYKVREGDSLKVEFMEFDGCATYGETLEHAIKMAHDALAGWLEDIPPENWPKPTNSWCYPDAHLISVLVDVESPKDEGSKEE